MVKQIQEKLPEMFKASPPWFAVLFVVGIFMFYIDRQEERGLRSVAAVDLVTKQRIEQCHAVQIESTAAIKQLNQVLSEQSQALNMLRREIERLYEKDR